jgi:hypothetical protein
VRGIIGKLSVEFDEILPRDRRTVGVAAALTSLRQDTTIILIVSGHS